METVIFVSRINLLADMIFVLRNSLLADVILILFLNKLLSFYVFNVLRTEWFYELPNVTSHFVNFLLLFFME